MRLALAAAVPPTASNAARRGAVVLESTLHARDPSEGDETRVVEFSTRRKVSNIVAIVADAYAIEASMISLLERAGYRVVIFGSADAFLAGGLPGHSGCVLLDLRLPDVDGLRVLRALASRETMPPVLVLSGHGDIYEAVEAMKLGAADVLEKPYPPEFLLAAIGHAVDAGPKRKAAAIDRDAAARIASLSQRQLQVLQGIVKGKPNKIIAYELRLSVRTVETYRAQLLIKLSVRGTAEAVRLALAAGML